MRGRVLDIAGAALAIGRRRFLRGFEVVVTVCLRVGLSRMVRS
jgi:hypothetical protein